MWGEGKAKRWYWGFYAGMGLAALTKGPVGVVVPLLAVLPYLWLTRRWRDVLRECRPFAGTLVFLAVAAPWYTAMFMLHGSGYADSARGDRIYGLTSSGWIPGLRSIIAVPSQLSSSVNTSISPPRDSHTSTTQ